MVDGGFMKVILKKQVKNVGRAGDVVDVSDGYAKNFLLKQNLAVVASAENMNVNTLQKKAEEKAKAEAKAEAIKLCGILKDVVVKVKATIGKNGTLFGSVTNKEISEELMKMGYNIDKKKIVLNAPIKALGCFKVLCKLYPEVNATLNVEVIQ